jgi:hypothetical protein
LNKDVVPADQRLNGDLVLEARRFTSQNHPAINSQPRNLIANDNFTNGFTDYALFVSSTR